MSNVESILVIILAVTLTVFLIAAIFLLVLAAKLLQSIRRAVDHAERVLETAGEAAEMLRNASGPLAIFKVVKNMVAAVDKMRK